MNDFIDNIIASRANLLGNVPITVDDTVEEGGCGVVGFAASVPVGGRNIFQASIQMHNRGNGKGGGFAIAGLEAKQFGVDEATLRDSYLLQVALLDSDAESEVEKSFITPNLDVSHKQRIEPTVYYRELGLEVRPPDITRYFVRVKEDVLSAFTEEHGLTDAQSRDVEDEIIYQNSFKLNQRFYSSLGDKQAFVMSHARDLMIFKIVGYAEQVVKYYGLEDTSAHVWIAHQRYPTKGRVWHPAGAHPFIGLREALVHNGDFANYFSISEYLRQHNIIPQFLTDTEVSVLLFDLLRRTYKYPLEYVIESLAPTTELDFMFLPKEKQEIYRAIQAVHMHGSPDGPWFFIIATSDPDARKHQLVGITDTAMLRPQVFALQEGDVSIGLVGSEKQAIDATLQTLSEEDSRFRPIADRYWNARGGSYTDGGAFSFTIDRSNGIGTLSCTDKFGRPITPTPGKWTIDLGVDPQKPTDAGEIYELIGDNTVLADEVFVYISKNLANWKSQQVRWVLARVRDGATSDGFAGWQRAVCTLTMLNDRRYDCGELKRSVLLQLVRSELNGILNTVPSLTDKNECEVRQVDWKMRHDLREPADSESILVINASEFPPEGDDCDARLLVRAAILGWKQFIVYGLHGQRFTGCGFGPASEDVRIDVYGSSGDYLSSGIDGMQIHVHDNAQDQLGQIMKRGSLVVHGDVGQTFMYGAKGGEVYVLGNAAGRPLINAVGRPRVVINGTCLDFLAESFMAGNALEGGGFVILNGIRFGDYGQVEDLESPYPGANLFSLASGGALYVRDPHHKLVNDQLNGCKFTAMTEADWKLILPYLKKNESHFGISIENDLLVVDGSPRVPNEVYRKVIPIGQDYDDNGLAG